MIGALPGHYLRLSCPGLFYLVQVPVMIMVHLHFQWMDETIPGALGLETFLHHNAAKRILFLYFHGEFLEFCDDFPRIRRFQRPGCKCLWRRPDIDEFP